MMAKKSFGLTSSGAECKKDRAATFGERPGKLAIEVPAM